MTDNINENLLLTDSKYIKQKEYWSKKLDNDMGITKILTCDKRNLNHEQTAAKSKICFSHTLSQQIMQLSNRSDLTIYIILLAALNSLIYRYTNSGDIVVISPIYELNATDETLNDYLFIREQVSGDMTFKDLLLKISQTVLDAYENQDYPIDRLMEYLWEETPSENSRGFSTIVCRLQNIHGDSPIDTFKGMISFSFKREHNRISGEIWHDANWYEPYFIKQVSGHFTKILEQLSQDVNVKIFNVSFLTDQEKIQLLHEFNRKEDDYAKYQTVYQLFEKQAEINPARIAAVYENQAVSYGNLNKRANQWTRVLKEKGIQKDESAALLLDRKPLMLEAILAVWKAGGAYIPLDPHSPVKRLEEILEESRARILLTGMDVMSKIGLFPLQNTGLPGKKVKINVTRPRSQISDFNGLPFPDRSLINYDIYSHFFSHAIVKNCITMQATRGCPYKCTYCHKIWPKNHVVRSAENIFSEVKLFYDIGIRRFVFIDDIFNFDRKNSTRFFQLIKKNNLKAQFFFPNGLRGDLLDGEYIDLMVEAGVIFMALALETGSPRLQRLIKKNLNLEKLEENIRYICEKHPQVITQLFTMHGFPTESEEEALMTLDFIKRQKWLHFAYIFKLKIFSGSEMEKLAIENGISKEAIHRSEDLAYYELTDTLPFDSSFTSKYMSDYFNQYMLCKERLRQVLPYQMQTWSEDEMLFHYNTLFPKNIYSINDFYRINDLLEFVGIEREELKVKNFRDENTTFIPHLNKKIASHFPVKTPHEKALRILLLDLSQAFSKESNLLTGYLEAPLGLLYLMSYLHQQFGNEITGKIAKSMVDFDNYSELRTFIAEFEPDLIGIRSVTFCKKLCHETAAFIRCWGFNGPIVVGGPYATSDFTSILQDANVDLAVIGEGEVTFAEVIRHVRENDGKLPPDHILEQINGIAFVPGETRKKIKQNPGWETVLLDTLPDQPHIPGENLESKVSPGHLAYIIYTSGSTGKPKGAMVEHIGMMNHIRAKINDLQIAGNCIIAQNASHTFDISVWQFFTGLTLGGKTVIYQNQLILEPDQFLRRLQQDRVTILEVVPSYLSVILDVLDTNTRQLDYLQYILVTGEKVKPILIRRWFEKFPPIKVVNAYGPTEASDDITHYIMDKAPGTNQIPIGKPIQNLNLYIVDQNMNLCPLGVKGEICVSGIGVGRGYLNNPELTAEKFYRSDKSYKSYIPKKIYRTGDLGHWLPDGNIEFFNRLDYQVKIRGHRIELGEIENRLLDHARVKEAVVIDREDDGGGKYLCAYWIPGDINQSDMGTHPSQPGITLELKEYLAQELPDYMVPSFFVKLKEIPLTANGKIDRKALPEPNQAAAREITFITEEMMEKFSRQQEKQTKKDKTHQWDINETAVLSKEDREKILNSFNDTEVAYPANKTISDLFAQQVKITPDKAAIVFEDCCLTYGQLNQRANQIGYDLKVKKGIQPDDCVGVLINRSFNTVAAVYGILSSGAAYVPIDAALPPASMTAIINDAQIRVVVTEKSFTNILDNLQKICNSLHSFLCLNRFGPPGEDEHEQQKGELNDKKFPGDLSIWHQSPGSRSLPGTKANNLAYVLYTSGTTGRPKGVMVENRCLVNFITAMSGIIDFQASDIVLSLFTLSFDMVGLEIFFSLVKGMKVVIGNEEDQLYSAATASLITREKITIAQATPSNLQQLISNRESAWHPDSLRYLLVGGEAFPPALLERARKLTRATIYNAYGPTEATVYSTTKDVTGEKSLNIGKPVANTRVYILGQDFNLMPIHRVGELCIGGAGVARGYLNQPQLTFEKFIENPFIKEDRLYRTGDLARWCPDGNIEFLGRMDHQVQIRGIRVELEEIENTLLLYQGIKKAVVTAREDKNQDKHLYAYVTSDRNLSEIELREFLLKELPLYMIPSHFIQMEKIPLTASGKVDRKLLEMIEIETISSDKLEAPGDAIEKKLAEIWGDVLEVEKNNIGIDTNFFDLGGHSLKATILIAQIHKELDVKVPLIEVFRSLTIRELSIFIKNAMKEKHDSIDAIEIKEFYPLSSAQKRLFITNQLDPGDLSYNMPMVKLLNGDFQREPVERTIKNLFKRHESLRTSFKLIDGEPVQQLHSKNDVNFTLQYYHLPREEARAFISRFIRPFDLGTTPLFRMAFLKINEKEHILIVDMHHIISDAASLNIFIKDFFAIYRGQALPELRIQYKDFSQWHNKKKKKETCKKQEEYWLNQFKAEIPILNLPYDFPRPETKSFEGAHFQFEINGKNMITLQKLASDENITLFILLLSVYYVLLSKLSGQEDIIIGTVHHGRTHSDLNNIVGIFVNTLAMRNYPGRDKTYIDFLRELKRRTIDAFENQDYPFEDLVGKLSINRGTNRHPLFNVAFEFQEATPAAWENPASERLPFEYDITISPMDLNFSGMKFADHLVFVIEYSTKLFEENTIERMGEYYKNIIKTIAQNPYQELADIEIFTSEEKEKYMTESPKIFTQEAVDHFDFS